MQVSTLIYPNRYREMIESAFPYIVDTLFGHWKYPLHFSAEDRLGQEHGEFLIFVRYENKQDPVGELEQLMEATADVSDFVDGMIYVREHYTVTPLSLPIRCLPIYNLPSIIINGEKK
jgi:hypothetical protein